MEPATAGKLHRDRFGIGSNIGSTRSNAGVSGQLIQRIGTSFFEQELARFSDDERFVYYEHVVAGVMHFDDPRVLHA